MCFVKSYLKFLVTGLSSIYRRHSFSVFTVVAFLFLAPCVQSEAQWNPININNIPKYKPLPQYNPPVGVPAIPVRPRYSQPFNQQPAQQQPAQQQAGQQLTAAQQNANAIDQQGVDAEKRGDWVTAATDFQNALWNWPNNSVIQQNLAAAINQEGLDAEKRGDWVTAVTDFQNALWNSPNDPFIQQNLANARGKLREQQAHQRFIAQRDDAIKDMFDVVSTPEIVEPSYDQSASAEQSEKNTPQLDTEFDGIKDALERLDQVRENNASETEKWQKASEEVTREAEEDGANLMVDLLTEFLKDGSRTVEEDLQNQAVSLSGETDPTKRKEIETAFIQLEEHKRQLKMAQDDLDMAHRGIDAFDAIGNSGEPTKPEKSLSVSDKVSKDLSAAWGDCEKIGLIPEGPKEMVDSAYDVTVQAISVERIKALNNNADEYLKAVTQLSEDMKYLVEQRKKQIPKSRQEKVDQIREQNMAQLAGEAIEDFSGN